MLEELKPYATYKNSGVPWAERVPDHWAVVRGKVLFSESCLPVRELDEIVTCFRDGQVTLRRNRRAGGFMIALKEVGYQGVRKGQLVIHAMDAFAGAVGVSDSDGKCTPEYIVCNPRNEDYVPGYFASSLRIAAQSKFIEVTCPAVRERAPRLRYPDFGTMLFPVPTVAEQRAIVHFIEYMSRRVRRYVASKKKLVTLLNEQRQAIVHRAVTRGIVPNVQLKPTGIEWLGDVPAHWHVKRLKSLVTEAVAGPYGATLTKAMYTREGYRVYGQQQVIPDDFTVGDYYISSEKYAEMERYRVMPHDVLVSVMGTVGRVAVVPESAEPGIINPRLVRYRPDFDQVSARYLQLAMQSPPSQAQLTEGAKGTTMEGLNMQILGNLAILVPPLQEQNAILNMVRTETQLLLRGISCTEREIALLREYRTRLIADVVTGKLDVREAAARLPDEHEEPEPLATDALDDGDESPNDADPEEADA
ncbi:restriction endonuclease subunit S [Polyangium mundeleinium]|uniref:Restriction endonuclease subunit S n=1 Tax=Polyangium mundeleinium TaxID=2995306 RepID=A0ABT5EGK4_9BACT|nr:restriction endonuclease subunit S [Polyangium mundeleinium]MDC0740957.1 restriction endonuclease subunit S [Polyangium mundeleinium]